jgi:Carboxypeptidase regulatory-like domain
VLCSPACGLVGWVVAWLAKQICLVFILVILPARVLGQFSRNTVTVSGVVLPEEGNQRIQHVHVHLCDSGSNVLEPATTSDSGEFSFPGLVRTPYILMFEASGFETKEIHVDLRFMSDKGMTVYLRPKGKEKHAAAGSSISADELSMPESARKLVTSARKKNCTSTRIRKGHLRTCSRRCPKRRIATRPTATSPPRMSPSAKAKTPKQVSANAST